MLETLSASLITFSTATGLFVVLYQLVQYESVHGRKVLPRLRGWVDRQLDRGTEVVGRLGGRLWQNGERLFVRRSRNTAEHDNVATLLRFATRTPLTVTHTDNHLSKIREHKTETTLTPAQKKKLSKQKLEERF